MIKNEVIILTGGSSTRFGSDKSKIDFAGLPLVEQVLAYFPVETRFIVVGPSFPSTKYDLRFTQEDPPGGGPVAALAAGLQMVESEYVALVATDMPFAGKAIAQLFQYLPLTKDALIPIDSKRKPQPLCAIYRVTSLQRALSGMAALSGKSMRSLISLLEVSEIDLGGSFASSLLDIDTPADLQSALRLVNSPESAEEGKSDARLD